MWTESTLTVDFWVFSVVSHLMSYSVNEEERSAGLVLLLRPGIRSMKTLEFGVNGIFLKTEICMSTKMHSLFLKTLERSYLLKINSKGKNCLYQLKVVFNSQDRGSEQGLRR